MAGTRLLFFNSFITPKLTPYTLVQHLGKSFRQAIGQCLHHDAVVVVLLLTELFEHRFNAESRSDGKTADIVNQS